MAGGRPSQPKSFMQNHHVIPKELGDFLFEYSIEWYDSFKGHTVPMAQMGSHALYTERIRKIIVAHHATISKAVLKQFAENLIKEIGKNYKGFQPNDIPEAVLQICFPIGRAPESIYGRPYKPVRYFD